MMNDTSATSVSNPNIVCNYLGLSTFFINRSEELNKVGIVGKFLFDSTDRGVPVVLHFLSMRDVVM